ncbi:MAG TPA: DsrE family protein [Nitrospiria bacterium]
MTDTALVLIQSNPLKSHRPVEALRIALGLISGEIPVTIILMNEAPRLLSDDTEDLVDGEILQKYLPTLKTLNQPFHVEESSLEKTIGMDDPDYRIEKITLTQIADFMDHADRFLIF